jgi:hypothetical protein
MHPSSERKMARIQAAACVLATLLFSSCTLCRVSAIEQAQKYQAQGYEVRIATYDLLLDGKLYGAFLWDHHAQAVVWKDGHYSWVGEFGQLSDTSTFRLGRMTVYWTIDEFKTATNYRR